MSEQLDPNWRPPKLETERLILRPVEITDAESIFAYAKNPNVTKYTLWEHHQSIADTRHAIETYMLPSYAKGNPEPFGITLKERPDQVIGTVGCFWVSRPGKIMELAYAIGEEHWGQGRTHWQPPGARKARDGV
jgi:ribosomal-protein-alanine N-acetyltransferase